ncbi:MAG: phosphorylase, partial [Eubacterium sp.]|nr:phosphorylase [Eubacterium sp.]
MIIHDFDMDTEPIVNMESVYGKQRHLVDKCLILYSKVIRDELLNRYDCSLIGEIPVCNGDIGIHSFMLDGERIAFYLSGTTATLAAETVCDVHWLTGASKFVMFGSCGSLDREKTFGRYIIPTESYRGEACSYYYAEPADYIGIRNADRLSAIFEEIGAPYVRGRVWTTGSMLRETAGLVRRRKDEGCLAVEMEL